MRVSEGEHAPKGEPSKFLKKESLHVLEVTKPTGCDPTAPVVHPQEKSNQMSSKAWKQFFFFTQIVQGIADTEWPWVSSKVKIHDL